MKVQDALTVTLFYYLYLSHETRDLMPCLQQAVTASQLSFGCKLTQTIPKASEFISELTLKTCQVSITYYFKGFPADILLFK